VITATGFTDGVERHRYSGSRPRNGSSRRQRIAVITVRAHGPPWRAASRFPDDYAHDGDRCVHRAVRSARRSSLRAVLSANHPRLHDDRRLPESRPESTRESLRVGDRLRAVPLGGFDAERSRLVAELVERLSKGRAADGRGVPFEFRRGPDGMPVVEWVVGPRSDTTASGIGRP
jgi:hypothetical protein